MAKKPLAYTGVDLENLGPIQANSIKTTGGAGFHGSAIQDQISGLDADLTNSVTSGGTTNTIADYSDLSTYSNDAAAIRNNIYQLARSVKVIQDGLRDLGLFS